MRRPFPSFEPYPFAPGHVNESAVNRAVADLEVVSPLFFGQILSRIEREAVGVFGVIEKSADVVEVHSFSSEKCGANWQFAWHLRKTAPEVLVLIGQRNGYCAGD